MTLETRPLTEITREALRLLYAELGYVETIRFLNQFTIGFGDYTAERRIDVERQTMGEVMEQLQTAYSKSDE